MTHLVQLVADYGPGDLAYAELTQRLALPGRLPTYPAGSQGPPEAHAILRPGDAWRRI